MDEVAALRFTSSHFPAAPAAGRFVSQKGASLQLGTPHALFKATTVSGTSGPYTVSADGKKFVMNTVSPQSITEPLTLITNWHADLKQ